MIIQLRGTSGSGKTTAMRKVMTDLGHWQAIHAPERKQPLYYFCRALPHVLVLGHYEAACGGCDNIGSAAKVYELAAGFHSAEPGRVILCEGLLLSEDTKWSLQMPDLRVIFLTTPVERCLENIRKRRAAAGNEKPLSESNTRNRVATIERARLKLSEAGKIVCRASADQAPRIVLKWIRNTLQPG